MGESFYPYRFGQGWLEVISGCMYSGKTEELIRQIRRAQYAKQNYQVFKPQIDNRYSVDQVASHNNARFPSLVVENAQQILLKVEPHTHVVGIDEAQFFTHDLIPVVQTLVDQGKRVTIAGLDTDWRGRPFGPMPELMAIADVVRKQYAICVICGEPATRTQRLVADEGDILVGSTGAYEARCRHHFDPDFVHRLKKQTKRTEPKEVELHGT